MGMQDLAVMCADPGAVKVSCLYCSSAKPERGSDALSRCCTCSVAFHKACYTEATMDMVGALPVNNAHCIYVYLWHTTP
jgi:ribosomal protein L37AE/L43A